MTKRKDEQKSHTDMPVGKVQEAYNAAEPEGGKPIGTTMDEKPAEETPAVEPAQAEVVPLPVEEYAAMLKERDDLKDQVRNYQEGWTRERADFQNYKRRIERDQASLRDNLTVDILKKYLAVLDDMERALKVRPTSGEAGAWAEGIELIRNKLVNILEVNGVQRIPAESETFDPLRHEALTHEDSPNHTSGQIIEVLQQGYTLGDRVIRPALVRVAR
ncbi:MAG TPA: nucleotide exchange factor GrpE [Anaerolineaceae bacterium]